MFIISRYLLVISFILFVITENRCEAPVQYDDNSKNPGENGSGTNSGSWCSKGQYQGISPLGSGEYMIGKYDGALINNAEPNPESKCTEYSEYFVENSPDGETEIIVGGHYRKNNGGAYVNRIKLSLLDNPSVIFESDLDNSRNFVVGGKDYYSHFIKINNKDLQILNTSLDNKPHIIRAYIQEGVHHGSFSEMGKTYITLLIGEKDYSKRFPIYVAQQTLAEPLFDSENIIDPSDNGDVNTIKSVFKNSNTDVNFVEAKNVEKHTININCTDKGLIPDDPYTFKPILYAYFKLCGFDPETIGPREAQNKIVTSSLASQDEIINKGVILLSNYFTCSDTTYYNPSTEGTSLSAYAAFNDRNRPGEAYDYNVCIIWNDKIKNGGAADINRRRLSVYMHELGHMWSYSFAGPPEEPIDHALWNNGLNNDYCSMLAGSQPQCQKEGMDYWRQYCEGHKIRAQNISWYYNQLKPYGEYKNPSLPEPALSYNRSKSLTSVKENKDLKVSVSMDTNVVMQGKLFFIDITLENNSDEDMKVNGFDLRCIHLNNNVVLDIPMQFVFGYTIVKRKSRSRFYVNPVAKRPYNDSKKVGHPLYGRKPEYWLAGNYRFKADIAGEHRELDFTILPMPDSLKEEFDDIWKAETTDEKDSLAKAHTGSFFEEEYYTQSARDGNHVWALTNKAADPQTVKKSQDVYKEFILKYPDNGYSEYFMEVLKNSREYNHAVLKEIISQLKENEKKRSKPSRVMKGIMDHFPEIMN